MKGILIFPVVIFMVFTACDLRVQRVREFSPEGPGVNYRINDCVGSKVKYMTGARWSAAGEPSCVLSAWDERDQTLWNALYAPGDIRSSAGMEVAVFPTRMNSRERIFILIQAVDTTRQNRLILAEYDSLGVRRYERPVMVSSAPISGTMFTDYAQDQVYVAGCVREPNAVQTFFMFRFRPETRGTWTRKYQDPSLRLSGVRWARGRDKGFVAAGLLDDERDVAYVRFDSIGGYKNLVRHETPENETGVADIDADDDGNIGLAAVSQDPETGAGYLTMVYDEADRLRWASRFDGPWNDWPQALVMAGNASAYVTGASAATGGRTAIVTVSYDREGLERWIRTVPGKEGEDARPYVTDYRYPQPGYVGKEIDSDLYIAGSSGRDAMVVLYNKSGIMKSLRFGRRGQTGQPVCVHDRYLIVNYAAGEKSGAYIVHYGPFEIPGIRRWD
jgi:hypothetical protein